MMREIGGRCRRPVVSALTILFLSAVLAAPSAAQDDPDRQAAAESVWAQLTPEQQLFGWSLASQETVGETPELTSVVPGIDPDPAGTDIHFLSQSRVAAPLAVVPGPDGEPFVNAFPGADFAAPAQTRTFFEASGQVVMNHFVTDRPFLGCEGQTEFSLFEQIDGLPTFPATADFVTPDLGMARGTGFACLDGDMTTVFVLGSTPGQPYLLPFDGIFFGETTPDGRSLFHNIVISDDPTSRVFPTITFASDRTDPDTYRFVQFEGLGTTSVDVGSPPPGVDRAFFERLSTLMTSDTPLDLSAFDAADPSAPATPVDNGTTGDATAAEAGSGDPAGENAGETGSSDDSSGGLPAWLWGIIGVTVLAAAGAAVKIGPFAKNDDRPGEAASDVTLEGSLRGSEVAEPMGDPADLLLVDAQNRGLPIIDGKQKVDSGRVADFEVREDGTLYKAEGLLDGYSVGISKTLTMAPAPKDWVDASPIERVKRFAYWVDLETMKMTIGGVDHPDLPKNSAAPPEESPELDGPDPIDMDTEMGPS